MTHRVLFVQGAGERGGAERVLHTLLNHFPAQGFVPMVCCCTPGPFVDELAAAGIDVREGPPLPRVRQINQASRTITALEQMARSSGASVVQANGERVGAFAGWAARRAGLPSVQWLHDAPLRSPASLVVQLAMKAARHDAVVCGSSWMTRDFHSRLGMKTQLVRNGVDLDACPSVPLDVRRLAGWPADTDVVAFVGRLQHWKGPDVFIRAAAEVAQRFRRARFLVVGGALYGWEEGYATELHELARRADLGGKLYFAGHRDDVLGLMAGSDVVAHCSRRPEPLGMVVAEAMALGRAVVATKTRGPEELIMPGRTGLLVPPGDVGALAASVGDLLADANQRSALGQAAAQAVAKDWSGEAMARGFASIYRRLVDNGRGDPRAQPSRRADDG